MNRHGLTAKTVKRILIARNLAAYWLLAICLYYVETASHRGVREWVVIALGAVIVAGGILDIAQALDELALHWRGKGKPQ